MFTFSTFNTAAARALSPPPPLRPAQTVTGEKELHESVAVYSVGPEPTKDEIARRLRELKEANAPFYAKVTHGKFVAGSSKAITHIPPGYRDMRPGFQGELALYVRTVYEGF